MARFQKLPVTQADRVAELMAQGLDTPTICERLNVSRKAVNSRISEIRRQLGWQAV
jgi:DNA-binding NarL/FixJ family response regulator